MRKATVVLFSVAGFALSAWAQADPGGDLPVQTQGNIHYKSGGVGLDESQALRREASHWPLELRFTGARGNYLADVHVGITKPDGTVVLDAISDGPYMLVKLPAGRYSVRVRYGQVEQKRSVEVSKHTVAAFRWREL